MSSKIHPRPPGVSEHDGSTYGASMTPARISYASVIHTTRRP
jgi:hypothetical protein